jgi:hypothetical protein
MASEKDIDRIASRVADKLKDHLRTAAIRVGELPTPCSGSTYTCDATSFTCQASLFSCPSEFTCSNKFTGLTDTMFMREELSEAELETIAKSVAAKITSSALMTSAGLGYRCPLNFRCSNEYNCIAPHSCPGEYTHKLL